MPSGLVEELAGEIAHRGVRDRPRQVSVPHHSGDVQVLDHQDLASVHQSPGGLVDEVSPGVDDLAVGIREPGPRSLATLGSRCGSDQGLVGRLELA